ncbi:receptor-type tyrosine-protein phosphatase N2-like [Pollicipes pollicipes]|uniref:receptor-type tyrosine-protein phosphatase N2-like n=1 Tax=Pollicipes pollicipes TaxID=41117 RepID=UPI001884AC9A|nr:receptor-type tyrosine-protein phosphatase N2-like [Pollicipes pollicipes]
MRRGATWLCALVVLLLAPAPALPLDFIGCLFEDLCEDFERCFSDGAFGRCVSNFAKDEDLKRVELSSDDLSELANLLGLLVAEGHRWSHIYTQCILQTKLLALETGQRHDGSACELVNDQPGLPPGSHGVPALPVDDDEPPPQDTDTADALVRFSPPGDGYAEELYVPTAYRTMDETLMPESDQPPPPFEWTWPPADDQPADINNNIFNSDSSSVFFPTALKRSSAPLEDSAPAYMLAPPTQAKLEQLEQLLQDMNRELQLSEAELSDDLELVGSPPDYEDALDELQRAEQEDDESGPRSPAELVIDYEPAEYANYASYADYYDADPIPLSVRSDPEFRRAERLDIKKPGPWFGVNNYAFDYDYDGKAPPMEEDMGPLPMEPMESPMSPPLPVSRHKSAEDFSVDSVDSESQRVDEVAKDVTVAPAAQTEPTATDTPQVRTERLPRRATEQRNKKSLTSKFTRYPDPKDAIDTTYTYLKVKDSFQTWKSGKQLVEQLEEDLSLPRNTFDNIRVVGDQVMFKVKPNPVGYNSSVVAAKIGGLRGSLEKDLGVTIVAAGVGDGTSQSSSVLVQADSSTVFVQTLSIVLGVLVAATVLVVLAVFLARRYVRSRDKLKGLANPDTEASKDYQELCRSRMAARVTDKTDAPEKPQRVHSLSKESDGTASPTSRSSTSSWSEEPVVSNMDISTGHMVLSYMEDHLKKKDKLEEEWRALCAYEAEPSARTVAVQPANCKKNRFPAVLPYDHSRVTLNAVTNATGGDFINASTITDHDPRNPAYIATQGPLPHTANDFWQMVWEQGSVVIVMLTRLTENGSGMCHRYWPEEGSELYHIYEVHLVSEHIWCDEYLVRSFYLKNLKTSETRTVTQFHFLAWPENGVPTSTKALLEFRRKVNKSYRGRSCPVIVHCSDGCGRTGTYCLIDMVLNRMSKGAKEIDIAASLEHIRDQRADMVRTRGQFEFVLMAVAEEVHAILKALPQ